MEEEEVNYEAEDYVSNGILISDKKFKLCHRYHSAGLEEALEPLDDLSCNNRISVTNLPYFECVSTDIHTLTAKV